MDQEKKKFRFKLIILIALGLILAFLAGISGEFIARYYLSNLSFFRDLYFTDSGNSEQGGIVINEPKKVVVELDLRANQVKDDVKDSVVGIYKKSVTAKTLLDKAALPDDFLGQAMVLTSDGWLISSRNSAVKAKECVIIGKNKKTYEIEKISEDPVTGLIFIKITAQNLTVVKIADNSNILNGSQVLAFNSYADQYKLANILTKSYQPIIGKYDLVNSTQKFNKTMLFNLNFGSSFTGAPVFNLGSELVGILSSQGDFGNQAVPISYIKPIMSQVLKGEEISRPYLGVNYLNLSQIYGLDDADRQGQIQGALLWPNDKGVAISEQSPLYNQLVKGDIIASVEDQVLDSNHDLADLLLEYKTGQQIRLKYWHENKENEISVVLK